MSADVHAAKVWRSFCQRFDALEHFRCADGNTTDVRTHIDLELAARAGRTGGLSLRGR
jgi:hypothetical protein